MALRLVELGPWGPVVFIGLYVVAALTLAPAFFLTVAAGAMFGRVVGQHARLRRCVAGRIGRLYGGGVLVASPADGVGRRSPALVAVRGAVAGQGPWVHVPAPALPGRAVHLLNYALALSGVRFRDFLIALVGMIPAIFMYTYYGKVVGDVAALAAGVAPPRGRLYYAMLVLGLVTTVLATRTITRAARQAIQQERARSQA